MPSHQALSFGRGRVRNRTTTNSCDIGQQQDLHRGPGPAAVGKVEAVHETEGRTSTEPLLHREPEDVS